jgi:hypothetical protein
VSTPGTIVEAQMEALLRRVAREQESQCRRAREAAEEQARGIVVRAWEEGRARLRQAVQEERRGIEHALSDRRAALETAARQREQAVLRGLIDDAWRALPTVLAASWEETAARREWCRAACALALRALSPASTFVAEVDAGASAEVAETITRGLAAAGAQPVEVRHVQGLGAGLRIRGGLACVDATVPGLLASREHVEAELLAELGRLLELQGAKS